MMERAASFWSVKVQTRLYCGVTATFALGTFACLSHFNNDNAFVMETRRYLADGNPQPPSFCSDKYSTVLQRIEGTAKDALLYNEYVAGNTSSEECFIDASDYSSYPRPAVDPCSVGGVILYVIGLIYCFLGLAIVCDEYFASALEVMVEVFGLTPDVAGATLMAAGGSAPELFTSLLSTFLSKSNIGISTIVGSAVFNVLFVIGCCAIFSKEVLCLSYWPLFRDSTYYVLSLSVLAIFYANGETNQIEWYECVILLGMYVGYVLLMKYNDRLKAVVEKVSKSKGKVEPADDSGHPRDTAFSFSNTNPLVLHSHFKQGLIHIMLKEDQELDFAKIRVITEIKGGVKEAFKRLDLDLSGVIEPDEFRVVLEELTGKQVELDEIVQVFRSLNIPEGEGMNLKHFEAWYLHSQHRVMAEAHRYFKLLDTSNDGFLDRDEIRSVIQHMSADHRNLHNPQTTEEQLDLTMAEFDLDKDGKVSLEQFLEWYRTSLLWDQVLHEVEENDSDKPLTLEWPDNLKGRVIFILCIPVVFPLWLTIPDLRREGNQKLYPLTWLFAIIWIAIFSYFMVWWATLLGDAAGLSPSVMGSTFLAAGTSIPDLITSVIVARQGYGDMAVSSSIGSNIFDILIGLPVPWLLFNIVFGRPIEVVGNAILGSVLLLIAMLVSVILTVAYNRWRMTKSLGVTMFVLYFIFLGQHLYRETFAC